MLMILSALSCKKEYEQYGLNGISSFAFADTANAKTHTAYIDMDSSAIVISWLYQWKDVDSIAPVITLPEGAVISPESGTAVAFRNGTEYTVTAQDGTKRTFRLKKALMQPIPSFSIFGDSMIVRKGTSNGFMVSNAITDLAHTSGALVNNATAAVTGVNISTITSERIGFDIPLELPTGYYTFRLTTGRYTMDADMVLHILSPIPTITSTAPAADLQAGDLITFTGKGYGDIAAVLCSLSYNGEYIPFAVESQTATTLTVRVPADAPAGTYTYARLISPDTGENTLPLSTGRRFTVIP
ncbi:hypothetical protein [Chitinophaga sp. XS-30]|uniref:hypothetical protein n=1 Tax=Chitinophaga sp. XS-30 TaxID=2604421 RepID=UPI0011DD7ECD|nr:hypothetical protein [Chitinophaga sp. XS-30]QEH41145.1 hypothetical protein FW415_09765 [Chitinophaga sp. XS-30]